VAYVHDQIGPIHSIGLSFLSASALSGARLPYLVVKVASVLLIIEDQDGIFEAPCARSSLRIKQPDGLFLSFGPRAPFAGRQRISVAVAENVLLPRDIK
jgi:hypothetical protein